MRFHGSIVALATPFKNGKVDEKTLVKLIEMQIAHGTDGIVPTGTTGESPTLSHKEHERVIEITVKAVKGRVPVIAGTGSNSTDEAISLTKFAKKVGADGSLLVTPYYNKPTQEGLYRHYAAIAKAVDLPLVLYNVPGRTSVALSPETVARLSKIPTIVAIKEATGSMDQTSHILSLCDIDVLSGDDSLTLPLMALGAKGVISVIANIVPDKVSAMVDAFFAKRFEEAKKLHYDMFMLCRALFIETNPIPVKTAMGLLGLCSDEVRLPLCPMQPHNHKLLVDALKKTGFVLKKGR
ncbi:MAG TPA: 4-hydroxy-tetrahydrodipicolinate synthase [Candidatus Omnitrophota bacterium]|nr:4-hydroxy-tetrahydrodipicolinate synthase [Candidatus Omnitrophota bacterium]